MKDHQPISPEYPSQSLFVWWGHLDASVEPFESCRGTDAGVFGHCREQSTFANSIPAQLFVLMSLYSPRIPGEHVQHPLVRSVVDQIPSFLRTSSLFELFHAAINWFSSWRLNVVVVPKFTLNYGGRFRFFERKDALSSLLCFYHVKNRVKCQFLGKSQYIKPAR